MAAQGRVPVFVLTGFLGSGKTVLLNSLLRQPGFSDSAVVVNEFGEIGLDHLLVTAGDENIMLLDGGCLCCAMLGSLKETLADLYNKRARGVVPPFRRVLIETSGLADPVPILQAIMRDGVISHVFRLAGLICAVDAVFGSEQLERDEVAREQVAMADRILVTKIDLVGGACPEALEAQLARLNPAAEVLPVANGEVSASALLGDEASDAPPWLGVMAASGEHHHHDHHPAHDASVAAESFRLERPATWSGLAAWISVMRERYGRDLLRCKGIVNVAGVAGPVVVHGVQGLFDTLRLPAWPDAERRSRLVVIGRDLRRDDIAASLAWLHAPEGTLPPLNAHDSPPAPAAL